MGCYNGCVDKYGEAQLKFFKNLSLEIMEKKMSEPRVVKIKLPPTNEEVNAYEVGVAESTEKWSEFTLEDGTVLKMKVTLGGAHRVVGKYDPVTGNPMYTLQAMPQVMMGHIPDELKKKN